MFVHAEVALASECVAVGVRNTVVELVTHMQIDLGLSPINVNHHEELIQASSCFSK